jgi:hypothetical protein
MKTRFPYKQYKQWLKWFTVILLALLAATAIFNFSVDSIGIFRPGKGLKYMVINLLKGRMVGGTIGRNDERELQKLMVDTYPDKRDVVAVGSSRTMLLRGRFIPGSRHFFNHSVTGALIEDYIAIVGLYRNKNTLPGTVIFGIDPWVFNKDNGLTDSWRTLDTYYKAMMAEMAGGSKETGTAVSLERKPDNLSKYKQLINLEYTIQNWYYSKKKKRLYVTDTVDVDDFVREPDGSIHFPYGMRHVKMANVDPTVAQATLPEGYYGTFKAMTGTGMFEDLVHYLKRHGVRVVFLLAPLYPASYRACEVNPKYRMTLKVEDYLRGLARTNNITVVGSFNPNRFGLKGEDFFDGVHGHDIVMKKLFEGYR